jgi:hypothetical protein
MVEGGVADVGKSASESASVESVAVKKKPPKVVTAASSR